MSEKHEREEERKSEGRMEGGIREEGGGNEGRMWEGGREERR